MTSKKYVVLKHTIHILHLKGMMILANLKCTLNILETTMDTLLAYLYENTRDGLPEPQTQHEQELYNILFI